jgi:glycosyltransferase involved in cell wall biosynthesis
MYRSRELGQWLRAHLFAYDLLDIQGVWLGAAIDAARAAYESSVPYVFTPHGQSSRQDRGKKFWKKFFFQKIFLERAWRRAAAIRFLGEEERRLSVFPPHPGAAVVPNFVQIPAVPRGTDNRRRMAGLIWDGPVILFLGRLSPQKGVLEILDAFERVYQRRPDAHLVLAGPDQGSYGILAREKASRMAGKAHIHFVGPVYDEKKWSLFSAATLFITLSRNEGLPMAVIEALGAGLPIVVTPETNVGAAIEAGAGHQVRLEQLNEVASGILEILENRQLREQMSRKAQDFFSAHYSLEAAGTALLSFYGNLLGRRPFGRAAGTAEGGAKSGAGKHLNQGTE